MILCQNCKLYFALSYMVVNNQTYLQTIFYVKASSILKNIFIHFKPSSVKHFLFTFLRYIDVVVISYRLENRKTERRFSDAVFLIFYKRKQSKTSFHIIASLCQFFIYTNLYPYMPNLRIKRIEIPNFDAFEKTPGENLS